MIFEKWNRWVRLGVLIWLGGLILNVALALLFPSREIRLAIGELAFMSGATSEALLLYGLLLDWEKSSYGRLLLTYAVMLVVAFTSAFWMISGLGR